MKFYFFIIFTLLLVGCKNEPKEQKKDYVISFGNSTKQLTSKEQSIARGKNVYSNFCLRCHMPKGQGVPNIYPPLTDSNWLSEKRQASIHAVKYGLKGEIKVNGKSYNNLMPLMNLNDQEVTDVLNFVMTSWGNTQQKPITTEEVSEIEK